MDFLKTITENLSKAAEFTVKKTGEVTDIARLKLKQGKITDDINDLYTDIGRLIYRQYKDQSDETQAIATKCLAIDKWNMELAKVTAELDSLRKTSDSGDNTAAADSKTQETQSSSATTAVCQNCAAEIPTGVHFCPNCGAKQDAVAVADTASDHADAATL